MIRYDYTGYEEYRETQIATNLRKGVAMPPTHSWIRPIELALVSALIEQYTDAPHAGICHGVRTGNEVRQLRELLESDVLGTDISNSTFADVVLWDFNERNCDWVGAFDFVYSNAFDHSYDPAKTIKVWHEQLRRGGKLFIHWGHENYGINKPNCVGGSRSDVEQLLKENGLVVVKCIETYYDDRYVFIAG